MGIESKRAELLRKRRRAMKMLRDTGMTDEEIERELGISVEEPEVIDAEIVSIEETPSARDDRDEPMSRAEEAVCVALAPVRPIAPRSGTGSGSKTGEPSMYSEEWWETVAPGTGHRRCRGHSTRTGLRCKQQAMMGTAVCRFHGGSAPHVQRAAKVRLDMAADRMAANLLGLAEYSGNDAIRLGATNSALDRAGIIRPTQVEVGPIERKPYEDIFDRIGGGSREESRARRAEGSLSSTAHEFDSYATDSASADPGDEYTGDGGLRGGQTGEFGRPAHHPRPTAFDREVDAETAIRRARAANAGMRSIESPHKRYKRPGQR